MRFLILSGFLLSMLGCRTTLRGGGQEVPYSYVHRTKPIETRYTECDPRCDWAVKEEQKQQEKPKN